MVLTSAVKVKGYVCFSKWVSARECPGYGSSILCALSGRAVPGCFWTWQAGSLPDRSGRGSGNGTGQRLSPIDNLDTAKWRARRYNSIDMGLLPFICLRARGQLWSHLNYQERQRKRPSVFTLYCESLGALAVLNVASKVSMNLIQNPLKAVEAFCCY